MKWSDVSEKNFKNIEIFAKDLIQHRYYGSMFTTLFLHHFFESLVKVLLSKAVLAKPIISEPIDVF